MNRSRSLCLFRVLSFELRQVLGQLEDVWVMLIIVY